MLVSSNLSEALLLLASTTICVPYAGDAPSGVFLVEFIEIDVRQQGGQIPSLRRSFFRLHDYTVFHDSTLEISFDELYHPLVFDVPSQDSQKQFMVQRVEILGQVQSA